MTTSRAARAVATITVVTAAVAIGWFALAPGWLGGPTTYVVTKGTSMEPRFRAGDLAIVRRASTYRVGQIVAYRSSTLDALVLHRVVGRDGSRYVLKGDNNDFVDPERPGEKQLVGALELRVPAIGRWAQRMRDPVPVGVLAGLATLCLLGGVGVTTRRRRRRRNRDAHETPRRPAYHTGVRARGVAQVAAVAVPIFGGALLLGYLHPVDSVVDVAIPYRQMGEIGYSAPAVPGPAYPDGVASTGEPLFLELLREARFELDYRFLSRASDELGGTAALDARVVSASGWRRVFELAPPTPFSGDRVAVGGTIRLDVVRRLLERVESATGVTNTTYRLELIPRVRVSGVVEGVRVSTRFAPVVPFALDHLQLTPPPDPVGADGKPLERALAPTREATVTDTRLRPRTLPVGGRDLEVEDLRLVGVVGVIASVCVLIASVLVVRRRDRDAAGGIASRYSELIASAVRSDEHVVEFDAFETLVRLAERYDRLIVHERREHGDAYWFAEEGLYYVYLSYDAAAPLVLAPTQTSVPRLRRVV